MGFLYLTFDCIAFHSTASRVVLIAKTMPPLRCVMLFAIPGTLDTAPFQGGSSWMSKTEKEKMFGLAH